MYSDGKFTDTIKVHAAFVFRGRRIREDGKKRNSISEREKD
jgi:hypothetical protein